MLPKFEEVESRLKERFRQDWPPSNVWLHHARLLEEESRLTTAFTDPKYFPFYYYLGKEFPAKRVMEIGFHLALPSFCYCQAVKPDMFLGFHEKLSEGFYSPRLAKSNIRIHKKSFMFYDGKITDADFQPMIGATEWELAIIDQESSYDQMTLYLEFCWRFLAGRGMIAIDYLYRHEENRKAYLNFCKIWNREPSIMPTRYGVGLIQK